MDCTSERVGCSVPCPPAIVAHLDSFFSAVHIITMPPLESPPPIEAGSASLRTIETAIATGADVPSLLQVCRNYTRDP